jgi:hypothetical protein
VKSNENFFNFAKVSYLEWGFFIFSSSKNNSELEFLYFIAMALKV